MGDRHYNHYDSGGYKSYDHRPSDFSQSSSRYIHEEPHPPRGPSYDRGRGRGFSFKFRGRSNFRGSPSSRGGLFQPERSRSFPGPSHINNDGAMDLDSLHESSSHTNRTRSPAGSGSNTPIHRQSSDSGENAVITVLDNFVQHVTAAAATNTQNDAASKQLLRKKSTADWTLKYQQDFPAVALQRRKATTSAKEDLKEVNQKLKHHQQLRDQLAADLARCLRTNGNLPSESEVHSLQSLSKEVHDVKCVVGQVKNLPKKLNDNTQDIEEMKKAIQALTEKNAELEKQCETAVNDSRKANAQLIAMGIGNQQKAKELEDLKNHWLSSQTAKTDSVSVDQFPANSNVADKFDELTSWKEDVENRLESLGNLADLKKEFDRTKVKADNVLDAVYGNETEVEGIIDRLENLTDKSETLATNSKSIFDELDLIKAKIEKTTEENASTKEDLPSLKEDLVSLKGDLLSLKGDLLVLKEERVQADEIFSDGLDNILNAAIEKTKSEISEAREGLLESITSLEARIREVESRPVSVADAAPAKELGEPTLPSAALALVNDQGDIRITTDNIRTLQDNVDGARGLVQNVQRAISILETSVKDLDSRLAHDKLVDCVLNLINSMVPFEKIKETEASTKQIKAMMNQLEESVTSLTSGLGGTRSQMEEDRKTVSTLTDSVGEMNTRLSQENLVDFVQDHILGVVAMNTIKETEKVVKQMRTTVNRQEDHIVYLLAGLKGAEEKVMRNQQSLSSLSNSVKDVNFRASSEYIIDCVQSHILDILPQDAVSRADFEQSKDVIKRVETMVKQLEAGQPTMATRQFAAYLVRQAAQWLVSAIKPEMEKIHVDIRLAQQGPPTTPDGLNGPQDPGVMSGLTVVLSPETVPNPGFAATRSNSLPTPGQLLPGNVIPGQQAPPPHSIPPRPVTTLPSSGAGSRPLVPIAPRIPSTAPANQMQPQQQIQHPSHTHPPIQVAPGPQSMPVGVYSPAALSRQGPHENHEEVLRSIEAHYGELQSWKSNMVSGIQARDRDLARATEAALEKHELFVKQVEELRQGFDNKISSLPLLRATSQKNSEDIGSILEDVRSILVSLKELDSLKATVDEMKPAQESNTAKVEGLWKALVEEVRKIDDRLLKLEQTNLEEPTGRRQGSAQSENGEAAGQEQLFGDSSSGPSRPRSGLFVSETSTAPTAPTPVEQPFARPSPRAGSATSMSTTTSSSAPGQPGQTGQMPSQANGSSSSSATAAKASSPDSILGPRTRRDSSSGKRIKRETSETTHDPSPRLADIPPTPTVPAHTRASPATTSSSRAHTLRRASSIARSATSSPAGLAALPAGGLAGWQVPAPSPSDNRTIKKSTPVRASRQGQDESSTPNVPSSTPAPTERSRKSGNTPRPRLAELIAAGNTAAKSSNLNASRRDGGNSSHNASSPATQAGPSPSQPSLPTYVRSRPKRKRPRMDSDSKSD
ncbi:hypothetical protein L228DRAFT_269857 [Xylona heveae TC161]|uniref:Uncharacterized protein n=1 Tax=Xylona heveae (strain CBS 132557 / TC161) TaxID=1328760 RepID=A0A165AIT6_XYLHT|nr:hypothetical protein L228DRAFT_269857 [Xylona heveae TC161]KZF20553.1 hypothetical protein L228DRAFT_269857 [Xylona heveae TC161]